MQILRSKLLQILGCCLILSFSGFSQPVKKEFQHKQYFIEPSSLLEVNGKTNINTFCCTSEEKDIQGNIAYKLDEETATFLFRKTTLHIQIDKLDCGAKAINKDLHKTLQADVYPFITMSLKKATNSNCKSSIDCDKWHNFETVVDITIGCTTRTLNIPVEVNKVDDNRFRLSGIVAILLEDFDIEPPTALLGLIKVKSRIDISFNLSVKLT